MRFYFFRWHTVNLVPRVFLATIVADDPPHGAIERLLQVAWLGVVVNITWPAVKWERAWSWPS